LSKKRAREGNRLP